MLQFVPPLHSRASPELSTATQNVEETQETALGEPNPWVSIGLAANHFVPLHVIKCAL